MTNFGSLDQSIDLGELYWVTCQSPVILYAGKKIKSAGRRQLSYVTKRKFRIYSRRLSEQVVRREKRED